MADSDYLDGYVYVSQTHANRAAGATVGIHGTFDQPCDNLDDAIDLAYQVNHKIYILDGEWNAGNGIKKNIDSLFIRGESFETRVELDKVDLNLTRVNFSQLSLIVKSSTTLAPINPKVDLEEVKLESAVDWPGATLYLKKRCITNTLKLASLFGFNSSVVSVQASSSLVLDGCSNIGSFPTYVTYSNATVDAVINDFNGDLIFTHGFGLAHTTTAAFVRGGSGTIKLESNAKGNLTIDGRNPNGLSGRADGLNLVIKDVRGTAYPDGFVYYSQSLHTGREAGSVLHYNGTKSKPCNDMSDAIELAKQTGYAIYLLDGYNVDISGDVRGIRFFGESFATGVRLGAGCNLHGTAFKALTVRKGGGHTLTPPNPKFELEEVLMEDNYATEWINATLYAKGRCVINQVKVQSAFIFDSEIALVYTTGLLRLSGCNSREPTGTLFIQHKGPYPGTIADHHGDIQVYSGSTGALSFMGGAGGIQFNYNSSGVAKVSGRNPSAVKDNSNGAVSISHTDIRGGGDLTPILDAIATLNDVTPAQIRAAFNEADFKDKNTEAEIHDWLDNYTNKENWKANDIDLSSVVTPLLETRNRANYIARNTKPL